MQNVESPAGGVSCQAFGACKVSPPENSITKPSQCPLELPLAYPSPLLGSPVLNLLDTPLFLPGLVSYPSAAMESSGVLAPLKEQLLGAGLALPLASLVNVRVQLSPLLHYTQLFGPRHPPHYYWPSHWPNHELAANDESSADPPAPFQQLVRATIEHISMGGIHLPLTFRPRIMS